MTIEEKISKIDAGVDEVIALNAELEQTLYGTDTGGKSHYDEFWDRYQEYGKRGNYTCAFAGVGWTTELFKPKYDIITDITAYMLFYRNSNTMDLVDVLEKAGIKLDTSTAVSLDYAFADTGITRLGIIDTSTVYSFNGTFGGSTMLETIEKLILKSDGSQSLNAMFDSCSALINLTIEGTIGQNGLNLQWSTKLSHDSLMSTINALKDYSADTSGTSWVVTLGSENLAKLTAEEILIAEQKGWDLV